MQTLIELIHRIIEQHQGEVMMAWVQFIAPIASGLGAVAGGLFGGMAKRDEDKQIRNITNKVNNWNAENESWYNTEMSRDYSQTPEALNMMRQLREEMDRQGDRSANNNVVSGATVEAQAADKDSRNKAMSNLSGNIAGMATAYKDRATSRYLNSKSDLQNLTMGMEQQKLGDIRDRRDSAGNMLYNGLTGLAGQDWAGILGKNK